MKIILLISYFALTLLDGNFFSSPTKPTVIQKIPPMDLSYEKSEALFALNEIREAMGMNTLTRNDALAAAAQAHADYLVKNHVASHHEVKGLPGFTGVTPAQRVFHAGYLSSQVSENLSTKNMDSEHSVNGLFSAIYHRFGFLDVGRDEIGIGVTQDMKDTENNAFVYVMGNSYLNALCTQKSFTGYGRYIYHACRDESHRIEQKHFQKAKNTNRSLNPKIILYPYDGEKNVPPAFYSEIPDPLPDYDVSGFPVSVIFNDYFFKHVKLLSFKLYKNQDEPITSVRIMTHENDPHGKFSPYEFALFPLKRLEYDTEYRAEIFYKEKGEKKRLSWHFHTFVPHVTMIRIQQKEATITIEKGKNYLLYVVPLNKHDVIKGVTFPDNVYVRFLDNNTLKLHLMSQQDDDFVIKSRYHTIHVKVK